MAKKGFLFVMYHIKMLILKSPKKPISFHFATHRESTERNWINIFIQKSKFKDFNEIIKQNEMLEISPASTRNDIQAKPTISCAKARFYVHKKECLNFVWVQRSYLKNTYINTLVANNNSNPKKETGENWNERKQARESLFKLLQFCVSTALTLCVTCNCCNLPAKL